MRLRAVEIRGFKSFADAVRLPLDARLIGIVGPNGCGKSNIADALRWVMGEQKGRLLRIDRSDNLIFNGSQRRKPLPFAEVTLEVEDFSPELPRLAFTRRVHRSGESEYFLNGSPARLKDFLSYFWQVSLSPQGILDGGQVEALIQDRGGARRALIESLAGIERYHHYKKEILAELEKTETALMQVESLLAHLQQEIRALSTQAEKVHRYQKLREKYRMLLLGWIAQELEGIAEAEKQYSEEWQSRNTELTRLQTEITHLTERLQALEARLAETDATPLESTHGVLQKEYQSLLREESRLQERLLHLEKQKKELGEELTLRKRQKEELSAEEKSLRARQESLHTTYREKQEALSHLNHQLQSLTQQLQKAEAALKDTENAAQKATSELQQLYMTQKALQAKIEPLLARFQQIEAEKQGLSERFEQVLQSRHEQEARLSEGRKHLEALLRTLQALSAYRHALQAQKEKLSRHFREAEAQRQGLHSQRKALEALLRHSEGWPPYLNELRAQGIAFWRTEDIFYASEAYLPYLGALLRMEIPTLWVTRQEDAERIHAFLQGKKEGFFAVRVYTPNGRASSESWLQHLQVLEGFEGLGEYLWGDVAIEPAEGQRTLSADARQLRLSDGQVYILSEASTQHIGLPHRIRHLQAVEAHLTQYMAELKAQLEQIERLIARLPVARYQHQADQLKHTLTTMEKELTAYAIRMEEITRRQKSLEAEANDLQRQRQEILSALETLQPRINEAEKRATSLREQLSEGQALLSTLRSELHKLQKAQNDLRLSIISLENDLKSTERAYKLTLQQIEEVHKRIHVLSDRGASVETDLQEAIAQMERLRQQKAALEPQLAQLQERLQSLRQERKEIEHRLHELRQSLAKKQEAREKLQTTILRQESRQAELTQKKALLHQRLSVELELSLADLPPPPSTRLKADEVERELLRIKEEIHRLGELNFEAASTLAEMQRREQEILTSRADIQHTLTRLRDLLRSLDKEAQEKFLAAFEAVRQRFIQLFQGLFSEGDSCDMILLQPDSPLTSEIDIIARPKGKRPISLQQLSGGEKALTVLALLFATFAVRPSALCVLDEVDAPLDDANTHKFGQLLRRMSQETPLLVITHNKITMSYCERLYGVTMPEPGVSAVLAVEMQTASIVAKAS